MMAKITIEYIRYSGIRWATCLSFVEGLLYSLCILPGIIFFAISVLKIVLGDIVDAEAWMAAGKVVLVTLVGLGFGLLFKSVFEKLAIVIVPKK